MTETATLTLTPRVCLPTAADDPRRQRTWVRRISLVRFGVAVLIKKHVFANLSVRPRVAELFVTDNCNLRCISCGCWRDTTRNELSTEEWKRVIDELAAMGIIKVNFTGGEALLRRDLLELIVHARRQGIGDLHLNTNGLLLTRSMVHQLLAAGVRSFNISIDGPDPATHDGVRGRDGSFERTLTSLRYLISLREQLSLRVRMNMTVLEPTVERLEEMARLAQELDVSLYLNLGTDRTFLFRHESVAPSIGVTEEQVLEALGPLAAPEFVLDPRLPRPAELEYVKHFFGADSEFSVHRDPPCAESLLKVLVHSTGEVGGCWGEHLAFNVRSGSIRQVVRSREYRRAHSRWFRKECVRCGSNYALNLRLDPWSHAFDARQRRRARNHLTR